MSDRAAVIRPAAANPEDAVTTSNLSPAAAAIHYSRGASVPLLLSSVTFRNWLRTLCWTLGAIALCSLFYCFDKWGPLLNQPPREIDHRMFKNPTELPMRVFGLPHFIIAFLFAIRSRRMRETRNRLIFGGLLLLGGGFCWMFYRCGAHLNPLAMFLFYFYFLVHGLRDDAFFYSSYGDMPQEARATHQRIMAVLQLLILGLLFSLIWPTYAQMSTTTSRLEHPILQNFFPANWPFVLKLGSMFIPMALMALWAIARIARSFPDGLAGLWRVHRPILAVFLISVVIILVALISGPWTFNVVVLMHFVGWYFFALFLIDRHPPQAPTRGWWAWLRTTRHGFMTLHLGLAALVTVLIAISVYGFGKNCWLEAIVGSKNFYYWTIMHVTLSFLPR